MSVPSWGANRVGIATAGWPLRGGRGTKIQKYKKNIRKKREKTFEDIDGDGQRGGDLPAPLLPHGVPVHHGEDCSPQPSTSGTPPP